MLCRSRCLPDCPVSLCLSASFARDIRDQSKTTTDAGQTGHGQQRLPLCPSAQSGGSGPRRAPHGGGQKKACWVSRLKIHNNDASTRAPGARQQHNGKKTNTNNGSGATRYPKPQRSTTLWKHPCGRHRACVTSTPCMRRPAERCQARSGAGGGRRSSLQAPCRLRAKSISTRRAAAAVEAERQKADGLLRLALISLYR